MDEDIIFEAGGHEYSAGKLDAKRQFHILRRLLPVFGGVAANGRTANLTDGATMKGALDALGTLPDEQFDYIADHCLSVVKRKDAGIWAAVSSPAPGGGRVIMYDDMDLAAIGVIVYNVLKRNLSGFFGALPSDFVASVEEKISHM
jgi:hypothetical protein